MDVVLWSLSLAFIFFPLAVRLSVVVVYRFVNSIVKFGYEVE